MPHNHSRNIPIRHILAEWNNRPFPTVGEGGQPFRLAG